MFIRIWFNKFIYDIENYSVIYFTEEIFFRKILYPRIGTHSKHHLCD